MVSYLILASMVAFFWMQPCLAHDSPEETTPMKVEEKQRNHAHKQQAVLIRHQTPQVYTKWVNDWVFKINILPPENKGSRSTIQASARTKSGENVDVSNITLIIMNSGKKFPMQRKGDLFQTSLIFPSRNQTTIMVKIKDKYGRIFFVQVQY